MNIGDVSVIDGNYAFDSDNPVVILDAATARKLTGTQELTDIVNAALRALYLSGKSVVYVKESDAP